MTDRQALVDLLIRHEEVRLKLYQDPLGNWTIGCGRNLTGVGISSREAMFLLDNDIDAAVHDLSSYPWFVGLDAVRQRAVTDFRFNVGPGTFRMFARFVHAMADRDYLQAAHELRSSRWATQVGARAVELAAMIETGTQ